MRDIHPTNRVGKLASSISWPALFWCIGVVKCQHHCPLHCDCENASHSDVEGVYANVTLHEQFAFRESSQIRVSR